MNDRLDPALRPRDGQTLNVVGICRISTVHQDHKSLGDQEALLRRYVAENYAGTVHWKVLSSQVSGQYVDTKTLAEAEVMIESGKWDLVIAEDLGRICRRMKAYAICESARDFGSRVIAINDHVDTGRDDWHLNALFGAFRHESYSRDTAKRIRRTLRHRFSQGGIVQFTIYGIIKPTGAKNDAELLKDPAAGPIYDEWFRKLEDGASYSEVADWLNAAGIQPGPYCRSGRWDVAMVRGTTFNPILKGVRVRNKRMSVRAGGSGRPRSVAAPPEELLERPVPHLAFIEPERYDRVVAMLTRRNAKFGRDGAAHPREGVPRKRTAFPGQHMTCGICGRLYYFGGHGRASHMMCSGNREYRCWNGVTVEGGVAAAKIAAAVLAEIAALPDFDPVFLRMVREESEALHAEDDRRVAGVLRREAEVAHQIDKITGAIAEMGSSRALLDKLGGSSPSATGWASNGARSNARPGRPSSSRRWTRSGGWPPSRSRTWPAARPRRAGWPGGCSRGSRPAPTGSATAGPRSCGRT